MRKNRAKSKSIPILGDDDLAVLRECVGFCQGYDGTPFKTELLGALERGYDMDRCNRIIAAVKHLSERDILSICEGE